jgi:hypothetical protein
MRGAVSAAVVAGAVLLAGCSSSSKASNVQPGTQSGTKPSLSASPSPTAAAPLSPFEDDPAVKALRAWAAQSAVDINAGVYTDPKLDAMMTPQFAPQMKQIAGSEVGHHYPGPVPFVPISAVSLTDKARSFNLCLLAGGFALNPQTRQPADPYEVDPMIGEARLVQDKWLVSNFYPGTFSCAGVHVPEVKS